MSQTKKRVRRVYSEEEGVAIEDCKSNGNDFHALVGTKRHVWANIACKTPGGLYRKDLCKNKYGKIVSKKQQTKALTVDDTPTTQQMAFGRWKEATKRARMTLKTFDIPFNSRMSKVGIEKRVEDETEAEMKQTVLYRTTRHLYDTLPENVNDWTDAESDTLWDESSQFLTVHRNVKSFNDGQIVKSFHDEEDVSYLLSDPLILSPNSIDSNSVNSFNEPNLIRV